MSAGNLLEREDELASLENLVESAISGRGRTIVIEGQPGLGKSSLLATTAARAASRPDLTLLQFCCGELEQTLTWAAVVGLLGPALAQLGEETRGRLFAGPSRLAKSLLDDPFHTIQAGDDTDGFGAVHALFVILQELSRRSPLLILLDDAHWADRQSLQFLAYVQRRLWTLPIGLVVAMRPAGAGDEPDLLDRIATAPEVRLHQLGSLAIDSVTALVHEQAFPEAGETFCEACRQVTAGNPFYLHELLLELRQDRVDPSASPEDLVALTPPAVLRSVLVRLGRLAADRVTGLAQATAVLGDGATLRHAASIAGIDPQTAADALDALAGAELLAPGEPLRFVHPLVRGAVYADIPAARRARQHARAAALLAQDHASPELVALHLLHAPLAASPETVATLRTAAKLAQARGAAQGAVRFLLRALEEPPAAAERAELLTELASAKIGAGDPTAVGHLTDALELVRDPRRRAEILLLIGWSEHHAGRFQAATDAFARGLAGELSDDALAAELEAGYLVSATLDSTRVADAMERIRVIASGSPDIQSPAHRMLLAQVLFMRTTSGAPHREIIELAKRIWAGGRLLQDEGADSQTLWHVVGSLSWADAYEPALEAIELALVAADERGLTLAHARARYARSWPNYWMGRISDAVADAQAAIEIWNGGFETYLPAAVYWFGLGQLELGDAVAAARALSLAGAPERWQGTGMLGFIQALQGRLHFQAGRPEQALASHLACGETMAALMISSPSVMPWRSEAAAALRLLGERTRARELAERELELAVSSGAPRAIAVALRECGLCAGGADAIRLLRQSADALEGVGATLESIRTQLELGAAIRRGGKRRSARPHLETALELARASGATVLAGRAETELLAAGGRERRPLETGVRSLTASERRVSELAAQGHSNRHISRLLQISVKGVEWHLHQSYQKLDIPGRRDLPGALTG